MKKIFKSTLLFFFVTLSLSAQNFTISGYITDSGSSETLISASVYENNSQRGTVSNSYGFYSLTLPTGNLEIDVSYVGYHTKQKSFKLRKDTTINIFAQPQHCTQRGHGDRIGFEQQYRCSWHANERHRSSCNFNQKSPHHFW